VADDAKEAFHQEHQAWKADLDAWAADVDRWRAEYSHLQKAVDEALGNHIGALDAHVAQVGDVERARAEHEHAMASQSDGHRLADADDLDVEHGAYASRHDTHKDAHARMGAHHRRIMVAFENLKAAFAEAE
jgi:hypothetical protein